MRYTQAVLCWLCLDALAVQDLIGRLQIRRVKGLAWLYTVPTNYLFTVTGRHYQNYVEKQVKDIKHSAMQENASK